MVRQKKLLAVASSGGHWVELRRLLPAFDGCQVCYVSTSADLAEQVAPVGFYLVRDASMWDKLGLARMAIRMAVIVLVYRPDVVISTGAAAGFFAIIFGKLFKAKTVWIDSLANAEELSLCGKRVRPWADHWLTQWPHLAANGGPEYVGAVL